MNSSSRPGKYGMGKKLDMVVRRETRALQGSPVTTLLPGAPEYFANDEHYDNGHPDTDQITASQA